MVNDKGLERELEQAGLPSAGNRPFMLPGETARDIGATCVDCGSRKVVYAIVTPDGIPPGAYCYQHLLLRCFEYRMIPYPIDLELLENLKADIKRIQKQIKER